MAMDPAALAALREHHPAWRLLAAGNAPLIAGFLSRAFIEPNRRELAEPELVEALEDVLYDERQRAHGAYPKAALAYMNDWAAPEQGWLRKYYVSGSDDAHYDLTPSTEKAIAWLSDLTARRFVGTESRLLTLIGLLRQMVEGTVTDPEARIELLQTRRAEIDAQIAAIEGGEVPTLDDTAIRDRFQQFTSMAADLLGDFRAVEHNFRTLDREVREQIALWQGSKGELLTEIIGERDTIAGSDQGKNFAGFWAFLMSADRQEELSELLNQVLDLDPVASMEPDPRLRRVHHDWLSAGEHAQRTVAQLSKQLRRLIDDRAWLENRRIMEILAGVEQHAISLRDEQPKGPIADLEVSRAEITLAFERPLASAQPLSTLAEIVIGDSSDDDADIDLDGLYGRDVVDRQALSATIRSILRDRTQVTLAQVCADNPLQQGLAELIAYLDLAETTFDATVDETVDDTITWSVEIPVMAAAETQAVGAPASDPAEEPTTTIQHRTATMPRVIIMR